MAAPNGMIQNIDRLVVELIPFSEPNRLLSQNEHDRTNGVLSFVWLVWYTVRIAEEYCMTLPSYSMGHRTSYPCNALAPAGRNAPCAYA